IAIDLSARAGGATMKQTAVASGSTAPSITGNVRIGGDNDVFDIADGKMTGNTSFGGGDNQLKLSGDAAYAGNASFGAGDDSVVMEGGSTFNGVADFGAGSDTLSIGGTARFTGTLANSAWL